MFFCYRNANSLLPPNFYQFRACKLAFRIRKNLFSSILSFYLKQNWVFSRTMHWYFCLFFIDKNFSRNLFIALSSMITMEISAFVDNFVYSFFAWIIFGKNSISLTLYRKHIFTYFYHINDKISHCCFVCSSCKIRGEVYF